MISVVSVIGVCLLTVLMFGRVATWTPKRGAFSPREMLGDSSDLIPSMERSELDFFT
jgi:hypothetical protein